MATAPFELDGVEPLKLIGAGGFGEVWLARQTKMDRKVAVKVGNSPIDDDTIRVRFERECMALGRLSGHPNIVDVFTAGQLEDHRPYLMLEYIDGGTLWQRLNQGPMTEEDLRRIGLELSDALSVAHTAGVLHRDLKPENVLLRRNGEAVLGDFGIARLHDGANTTTHSITASVAYAAPEVLTGKPASMATDLYGLGICLLSAAVQGVPFVKNADESVHPIINRVLSDRPADLRKYDYSSGLAEIVAGLLEKDPKQRPLTAEVVQQQLFQLVLADTSKPEAGAPITRNLSLATTSADRDLLERAARTSQPVHPTTRSGSFRSSDSLAVDLAEPDDPDQRTPRRPRSLGDRIRLFGATFGATLLFGGLIVFAINRYAGVSLPSVSGGETPDATQVPPETGDTEPPTTTSTVADLRALALPIDVADLDLSDGATSAEDRAGPDSSQFCGATPTTTGLTDSVGETIADPLGFPLIFQQLARFETPEDAERYLSSYLPAATCDEWTIPLQDGTTPPIVLMPRVVPAVATYGDETVEVVFAGASGDIELFGRVIVIRDDGDVYILSINSVQESDLDQLDGLAGLAATRLGM